MTVQEMSQPVVARPPLASETHTPMALGLNKRVKTHLGLRMNRARSEGFHPSDLANAERGTCPVLETQIELANLDIASGDLVRIRSALAFRRAVLEQKKFEAGLQMEGDVGDAIHKMVQFQLGLIGWNWGVWECPNCHARTPEGFMPRTMVLDAEGREMPDSAPCRACLGRNFRYDHPWEYVETNIGDTPRASAYELTGNMDGDLRPFLDGAWFRYVLEIKSIHEAGYQLKRGPLPKEEHVKQASLYGWALGIDYIVFIYVDKNQVNEWKEFVVPVDMKFVQEALTKIEAVRAARGTGLLPIQGRVCCDFREKRAQTCPGAERCFGQKAPPNFMSKGGH